MPLYTRTDVRMPMVLLLASAGVVAWSELVPRLYTSLMWAFHVPVGTATATPPFSALLRVISNGRH